MGKRKHTSPGDAAVDSSGNDQKKLSAGGQHCPSTVFVSNLPYSYKSSELEAVFSEVGPVRRCFVVAPKGSEVSREIGFVQFAAEQDAERAIQLKNGSAISGRNIRVQLALHRLPLVERQQKKENVHSEKAEMTNKISDSSPAVIKRKEASLAPKIVSPEKIDNVGGDTEAGSDTRDKLVGSEKQRNQGSWKKRSSAVKDNRVMYTGGSIGFVEHKRQMDSYDLLEAEKYGDAMEEFHLELWEEAIGISKDKEKLRDISHVISSGASATTVSYHGLHQSHANPTLTSIQQDTEEYREEIRKIIRDEVSSLLYTFLGPPPKST